MADRSSFEEGWKGLGERRRGLESPLKHVWSKMAEYSQPCSLSLETHYFCFTQISDTYDFKHNKICQYKTCPESCKNKNKNSLIVFIFMSLFPDLFGS